jgi:hypothetical protein
MARPTCPLRFTHDRVRELVRLVAEREGISQNELLEQAAEHEVIARGGLLADELEASAAWLRAASAPTIAETIEESIGAFVEAEALPEPLRPRQIARSSPAPAGRSLGIGAVAAFKQG